MCFLSGWRGICRGDIIRVLESCALLSVPSAVATDPLTGVILARLGGGGRCLLFKGPCVH
jgi:hypothetical protein